MGSTPHVRRSWSTRHSLSEQATELKGESWGGGATQPGEGDGRSAPSPSPSPSPTSIRLSLLRPSASWGGGLTQPGEGDGSSAPSPSPSPSPTSIRRSLLRPSAVAVLAAQTRHSGSNGLSAPIAMVPTSFCCDSVEGQNLFATPEPACTSRASTRFDPAAGRSSLVEFSRRDSVNSCASMCSARSSFTTKSLSKCRKSRRGKRQNSEVDKTMSLMRRTSTLLSTSSMPTKSMHNLRRLSRSELVHAALAA